MNPVNEDLRTAGLACARGIADWLVSIQQPFTDDNPAAGSLPAQISRNGAEIRAAQWNNAFAIMGMLSAYREFGDTAYEATALKMAGYLKTLQILDPFSQHAYGAIRELTPQTPWCYVRDALSGAWGFLELYRYTHDDEYLERARLWGEWFLRCGMDDEGWPLWGCPFGPYLDREPQMRNDVQGSFHGGGLNFFYHLAQATGDRKWTGDFFMRMADHFVTHIQQDDGFFRSVSRNTHRFSGDPQNGLHRANDDLGSLGLLCAYKIRKDDRYLKAVNAFLEAVFNEQRDDGHFEESCAGIPVVLNTVHEGGELLSPYGKIKNNEIARALQALYLRQSKGSINFRQKGGMLEKEDGIVNIRASCYSLIVLLKLCGKQQDYLCVH